MNIILLSLHLLAASPECVVLPCDQWEIGNTFYNRQRWHRELGWTEFWDNIGDSEAIGEIVFEGASQPGTAVVVYVDGVERFRLRDATRHKVRVEFKNADYIYTAKKVTR